MTFLLPLEPRLRSQGLEHPSETCLRFEAIPWIRTFAKHSSFHRGWKMCINLKCLALLCLSSLSEGRTSAEASLEGVPTSHPSLFFLLLSIPPRQSELLPCNGLILFAYPAEAWSFLLDLLSVVPINVTNLKMPKEANNFISTSLYWTTQRHFLCQSAPSTLLG